MDAASFDVRQAFRKLGIDGRALLRRVLVARIGEPGDDRDHAAGRPEFELLPALKTSRPADGERNHKRRFVIVFDSNGHSDSFKSKPNELSSSR